MTAHIEPLMVEWLGGRFPDARVCTELPAKLVEALPAIQIGGIGGRGDKYRFDSATTDFDCFAATRDAARHLAMELHDALLTELPGAQLGDSFVLGVEEFAYPNWTPYENTAVRRFVLSVQIRLHTRSAA